MFYERTCGRSTKGATMIDLLDRVAGPDPQSAKLIEFTRSELFARTFREGMDLVEETAAYLDGPGRSDAKRLGTDDALIYATQSMRLTTRLMQVASWLLVQRSVREGEMGVEDARADKYRIHAERETDGGLSFAELARAAHALPATLLDLMARSDSLYKRIHRLDVSLYASVVGANGVADQMSRLQSAFRRTT